MAQSCPHCGVTVPETRDAFCFSCRNELSPEPTPLEGGGSTQPSVTNPPPAEPEPTTAAPIGELTPEERTAQFWLKLYAITPRATMTRVLIGINVLVFVMMAAAGVNLNQPSAPDLLAWGANFAPKTLGGEWWRILTCMFVHIGFLHILLNMWVLAATGPLVERMLGNAGFLLMYLISGLCGSLASLCFNPDVVSAGASGAVFGVYGALLGLLQQQRESVPPSALASLKSSGLGFIAYNVVFGLMQPNIDLAAHAGGLVAGFLCGLVLSRPFTPEGVGARQARNLVTAFGGLSAVVIGLMFLTAVPPGAVELDRELNRCDQLERRATNLINIGRVKFERGEITTDALADIVERDVLPEWRAARNRLSGLREASQANKDHVALVLDYMRLREEGWALYVESVRTGDEGKAAESVKRHNRADAVGEKPGAN